MATLSYPKAGATLRRSADCGSSTRCCFCCGGLAACHAAGGNARHLGHASHQACCRTRCSMNRCRRLPVTGVMRVASLITCNDADGSVVPRPRQRQGSQQQEAQTGLSFWQRLCNVPQPAGTRVRSHRGSACGWLAMLSMPILTSTCRLQAVWLACHAFNGKPCVNVQAATRVAAWLPSTWGAREWMGGHACRQFACQCAACKPGGCLDGGDGPGSPHRSRQAWAGRQL